MYRIEGIGIARLALVNNFTRLMLVITLRKAQSRDSVIAQKLDAELSESKRIEQQRQKGQSNQAIWFIWWCTRSLPFVSRQQQSYINRAQKDGQTQRLTEREQQEPQQLEQYQGDQDVQGYLARGRCR